MSVNVSKEIKLLSGYKTYIVAVVTAVLGVYNLTTSVHLTTVSIMAFVAAGGLAALRSAVAKVEAAIKSPK